MRLDYDYDLKKRTPRGYIASTSLRIRQDDLSKLATVLDVASLLDVDGLSDLRFRYHLPRRIMISHLPARSKQPYTRQN